MTDKTNAAFTSFRQFWLRIVNGDKAKSLEVRKLIFVHYKGHLGEGQERVALPDLADFNQLLQLFHIQIGQSPTYTFEGGFPRFSIQVPFTYQIKVNHSQVTDFATPVRSLVKAEKHIVYIEIIRESRVD